VARVPACEGWPPRVYQLISLFEHAPTPCLPSLIGFHDTVDDELAWPRRAADDAAQLERACRCSRRSRTFTLDEGGGKGVVCSCVAAVDVLRQISMAMPQAGRVATTAWWCGRFRAS
jgi:hypothetical protein